MFLAGLYLTATVVNVLLAASMAVWWPVLLAGMLALAAVLCVLAALAAFR
jgi:NaMN:DMB phosphoribosyltransferase